MSTKLIDPDLEQKRREKQREYVDFLDDDNVDGVYAAKIDDMIKEKSNRLIVNINDLHERLAARAQGLMTETVEEIMCLQNAIKDIVSRMDADAARLHDEYFVGFDGSFGQGHVNPRTLKAQFLGTMVCCEGSLVRPKVVRSVHYCPATDKTVERRYTDLTSYNAFPSSMVYPKEDENKNPLETEFGLSVYKDHQTFSMQELPETAPAGQLPRSVDVVADNDLADRCKPGDRVRVIALFRCLPNKQGAYTTGTFKTIMIANNIQLMSKETSSPTVNKHIIQQIRSMSKKSNVFDILARSLAPSIHGHEWVKKAILCQLLGGSEKILANGTRLRGDINLLLIGDPSVAKSQLLRYVLHTAPRAINTTGRGTTGVGLTAAVTSDPESGERRLEAGAMVLGDRGIVCIDEFDKMSDIDRTAIHEVMEQGRVTIAKAGIHAKLNARCSVLAAANPIFGRYDLYKTPMENISMQDSLLSRFDLLFVLLDEHEPARDSAIAEHVLQIHRYRGQGENDGAVLQMGSRIESLTTLRLDDYEEDDDTDIWEKNRAWMTKAQTHSEKILTMKFVRTYVQVARSTKPQLTDAAANYISEKYCMLRSDDERKTDRERTMPVTARQLETLIRLSTAIAKSRLSKKVAVADAEKAFELLHFACFKEKPRERKIAEERAKARKGGSDGEQEEDEEETEETVADQEQTEEQRAEARAQRATKRRGRDSPEDVEAAAADSAEEEDPPALKKARRSASGLVNEPVVISVDRFKVFRRHVRTVIDKMPAADQHPLDEVTRLVQAECSPTQQFTPIEVEAAWERMQDENAVMISDDMVTII